MYGAWTQNDFLNSNARIYEFMIEEQFKPKRNEMWHAKKHNAI